MTRRPSRLWRVIGATQPLFTVESPLVATGTDDHVITSLTIESGTTMAGMTTAAATVELATYGNYDRADKSIKIKLTDHGAARLAALTGRPTAQITDRFTGRVAGKTITDNGDTKTTDFGYTFREKQRTTLTAQDWPALISQIDAGGYAARSEPSVWRLFRSLFTQAGVPGMRELTAWGGVWHWVRFTQDEEALQTKHITTADVIGKFAADLGILIRQVRDGQPMAWSHDHLITMAESWKTTNPDPLQRSQVIAPAEWTRPLAIPQQVRWEQHVAIGNHVTTPVFHFTPTDEFVTKTEAIDMTHIWDIKAKNSAETGGPPTTGLGDVMRARVAQANSTEARVEKVSVDVLGLLERNHGTDRNQIGNLLALNHGDPLALGYDWPAEVSGVYFAGKITHRITGNAWVIDLELTPARHVTGQGSPTAGPGRTWDTAYPAGRQWDTPSTTWETSP